MKTLLMGAALLGLLAGTAMAQPETQYQSPIPEERTFLRSDDKYEGLAPGEGRENRSRPTRRQPSSNIWPPITAGAGSRSQPFLNTAASSTCDDQRNWSMGVTCSSL